tara:strand:- start:73 stop:822 length:750 start_codon:yes stop_codon:yes gene_type:complete
MGLFRHTKYEKFLKQEKDFELKHFDTLHPNEWGDEESKNRVNEENWIKRYEYEANLIKNIIEVEGNKDFKNFLELGSGPGVLSQKIQNHFSNLNYHLIDKPFAKKIFEEKKYKGTFFTQDLSSNFNTEDLLSKYDFVITNDFLEHVLNPSLILQKIHKLTHSNSIYMISNPNWRMGHHWIYRGLFDFDNLIYFLYVHGFEFIGFYPSCLTIHNNVEELKQIYPKLDSEELLPDENINSWNHYMIFKQRK